MLFFEFLLNQSYFFFVVILSIHAAPFPTQRPRSAHAVQYLIIFQFTDLLGNFQVVKNFRNRFFGLYNLKFVLHFNLGKKEMQNLFQKIVSLPDPVFRLFCHKNWQKSSFWSFLSEKHDFMRFPGRISRTCDPI